MVEETADAEEAPAAEEKKAAAPKSSSDDLKKIEGVGPKTAQILTMLVVR